MKQAGGDTSWRESVDRSLNFLRRGPKELKAGQAELRQHIDTHATLIQTNTAVTANNTDVTLRVEKRLNDLVTQTAPAVRVTDGAKIGFRAAVFVGKVFGWILTQYTRLAIGILSTASVLYFSFLIWGGMPFLTALNKVVAYFNGTVPN